MTTTTIFVKCDKCGGSGSTWSGEWGTPQRERVPCECGTGAVAAKVPAKSKLKGIEVAEVEINAAAYGNNFDHPVIRLRGAMCPSREYRETVWEIRFQRNLVRAEDYCSDDLPDPRLDVGPIAWSACYGASLRADRGFKLGDHHALLAAAAFSKRLDAAMDRIPYTTGCQLARTLAGLALLGVPTQVTYYWTNAGGAPRRGDLAALREAGIPEGRGAERIGEIVAARKAVAAAAEERQAS